MQLVLEFLHVEVSPKCVSEEASTIVRDVHAHEAAVKQRQSGELYLLKQIVIDFGAVTHIREHRIKFSLESKFVFRHIFGRRIILTDTDLGNH